MGLIKFELKIPQELGLKLGRTKEMVSKELKKAAVIQLFCKGQISSGKAAEILEMDKSS